MEQRFPWRRHAGSIGLEGPVQALTVPLILVASVAGCTAPGPSSGPQAASTPTATVESTATQTPTSVDTTPTQTPTVSQPSSLESTLYRLVQADDRASFAETHGIRLRNGDALVVIELADDADLPGGYDIDVTVRVQDSVEAYVDVDDLLPLAREEAVRRIRRTVDAVPQEHQEAHHDS